MNISPKEIKETGLTESQLGIYLECIDDSNYATYLIPLAFRFAKGSIDPGKLAGAFSDVSKAYTAFRTVIKTVNAEPIMTEYDGTLPELSVFEVSESEAEERRKNLFRPFAFDGSLLWRGEILVTPREIILALVFHHSIFDGTSVSVLSNALADAYEGKPLSESNTPFDAKAAEDSLAGSDAEKDAKEYFDKYLGGIDGDSNIVTDKSSGSENIPATAVYRVEIPEDEVKTFARDNGLTENIVFLSAFAYSLSKFNNQPETLFSSVESGRFGGNYVNSIGMFVKSFPLHITVSEDVSASDFAKSVKTNFFDTLKHNRIRFSTLVKENPGCADVRYIYQGEILCGSPVGGASPEVDILDTYEPISNFDFMVYKADGEYYIWLGYKNALYTRELIDCFADLFMKILGEFLTGKKLSDFNLVSEKAKALIDGNNRTESPFDTSLTVNGIFSETARKFPDKTAVSSRDGKFTYAELDSLTDRLGAYISSKGIGRDDFVSVLIPRNEYMAVCALGTVKAGAAYQPLDPTYPKERLNFMVSDSRAKLLIADRSLVDLADGFSGEILYTDEIENLPEPNNFGVDVKPDSAILLIYTSGTTGTPKGCILENGNIVAFCRNHAKNVELTENSKVATIASFGFDAAAMDIFSTLLTGGELCVIPDEIKLDIPEVEKFYIDNGITNGFMTTQLGRMFLESTGCRTLRHFVLGGEKLVPFTPPTWVKCHNDYGPSETIAYICGYDIKDNGSLQPIGKPNGNTKLYIVDSNGRLLPPGACGELCVAGLQVGRGYFERPEKTAEVFVKNPFSNEPGYERMYRTGDVVRMLPDGNMDFIGRRDGQVKIRGFRIELTEIEQIIREYKGIKNATVQAFDDPVSGKFVAAFIVSDEKVDADDLNRFILSRKPPYMVPAVTMQLDAIPVNANGKVDRRKLPKPERRFEEGEKPGNRVETDIFEIISKIVGTDAFGIDTDVFLVGLSSIGSIRLCSLLAERFGRTVQMKDIKTNNTVRKLGEFLSSSGDEVTKREILADYPITKTQEGIFVECISKPDSTFYNIPLLLKISEKIDVERLKCAIASAVEAHSYILTELFTDKEGNVRQRRNAVSYSADETDVVEGKTEKEILSCAVTPFALTDSRLFRFRIYRLESTYLFAEFHHIISDGTSINIILSDIEKAYRGETLTPEAYSSFDLAYDEAQKRGTAALSDAKSYYSDLLSDTDCNFLPGADRLPTAEKSGGKLVASQTFTDVRSVKEFCERNIISVNGLLCGAFGFVLAKYAGTDYSVFNTVYNGRNDSRATETVGMLVKTLPVVCKTDAENSLDIAKSVSAELIDGMSNDLYSYAEIAKDCGVKNDIIFVYQGDSFAFDSFCGEKAEEIGFSLSDSKAPITLEVAISDGRFKYTVEYSADLFTENLIKTLISAFDRAIYCFVNEENTREISLVTDEIKAKLDEYNRTEVPYDTSKTVSAVYAENAAAYPDRTCVVYKDKAYTYGEAFGISCRIAAYLLERGIGDGDVVAILIHRDENMILTSNGVVMSGAAYIGLDPTYPKERLGFMLSDSKARILIADRTLVSAGNLADGFEGEILYTDEIESLPENRAAVSESIMRITPENKAIVIYSSGTTGTPKGAMLTHGNIVCFCHNYTRDMKIGDNSHIATYASFGFDGGAMDMFCTPMSGATLYIIPDDIRLDMEKLEQFYVTNKITSGFMTTQVGAMFIGSTKCKTLKYFMVGGEKFIPAVAPERCTFYNAYGPSETMCYVNKYHATDMGDLQPIGKVNRNLKEYIIDKFGNRLPFGAAGELCISGGQVGLGYLNRPEKTAEAFVKNPFCSEKPYDRMYKTGDIVRQLPDGNYVFVGRRDGQVKIRGFRVELSEIEQRIRQFKGIKNVTVAAFDSKTGGKFLAAYVVSDSEVDVPELNRFISEEKPDYMVPAVTMQIDGIPLTSNGKVDKKKLPAPVVTQTKKGAEPANETEETLCGIFEDVLKLDKVYADDDFFTVGGSSISAIQAVVRCNNAGYEIVFKNLFANPTPHALSEFILGSRGEKVFAPDTAETEKFDYSSLEYNTVDHIDGIVSGDIGDVLLTGSTGFLGSHLLRELLDNTPSNVICLVRGKGDMSAETRFRMMMTYYFEDWYTDDKAKRVRVVEGELGDEAALEEIRKLHFDTVINSAANVKHFAAGDELLRDNYSGVEGLISLAEETKTLLVQISSTSVSGEAPDDNFRGGALFCENELNIGQSLENKYIYSKYQAEQAIVDAISRSRIRGKIIRLGNLMARIDDSEFQINAGSSGFLNQFLSFRKLAMFPINMMDKKIEFSPIDSAAKAIVLLSGTPDRFTVFHAKNCNSIHYGYFIGAMKKNGIDINIVGDRTFNEALQNALDSEKDLSAFTSLLAYRDNRKNGEQKIMHQIESDTEFTTKALYRLGFAWPLISSAYLEKMVKTLIDLGFFA